MNTDSVLREDQPSQPLVQWYPRGGPTRAVSPDVIAVAGVAVGFFLTAAVAVGVIAFARRASRSGATRDLSVDRLIVRKLQVLER